MNKRQAKIEALYIASGLCTSCDHGMFDGTEYATEDDEAKVMSAIYKLGFKLKRRAKKLEKSTIQPPSP